MATLTREEAAKRFEELPLPTTADEHWRFTDLRGFSVPEEVSDTKVSDTISRFSLRRRALPRRR